MDPHGSVMADMAVSAPQVTSGTVPDIKNLEERRSARSIVLERKLTGEIERVEEVGLVSFPLYKCIRHQLFWGERE